MRPKALREVATARRCTADAHNHEDQRPRRQHVPMEVHTRPAPFRMRTRIPYSNLKSVHCGD